MMGKYRMWHGTAILWTKGFLNDGLVGQVLCFGLPRVRMSPQWIFCFRSMLKTLRYSEKIQNLDHLITRCFCRFLCHAVGCHALYPPTPSLKLFFGLKCAGPMVHIFFRYMVHSQVPKKLFISHYKLNHNYFNSSGYLKYTSWITLYL